MRAANKLICLAAALAALAALGACREEAADGNAVILNEVPANADIEMLPPDESVTTPSDDLAEGAADPQVDDSVVNAD